MFSFACFIAAITAKIIPIVTNAPAAVVKNETLNSVNKFNVTLWVESNGFDNVIDCVPIISLIAEIINNANPYPNDWPKASIIEGTTLFLLAKASALPKIIQLTTIKLINIDNVDYSSGVNASINNATQVTNVATMII